MFPAATADILSIGPDTRRNYLHHVLDLDPARAPSRERAAQALTRAVATWPLLACRYDDTSSRPGWRPIEGFDPSHFIADDEIDPEALDARTSAFVVSSPSLRHGPPIRLVLLRTGQLTRLIVKLHHGVSDAMGGLELLRLLGAALYDVSFTPESGPRAVLDLVREAPAPERRVVARAVARQLAAASKRLRLPQGSSPRIGAPSVGTPDPAVILSTLDKPATLAAVQRARNGASITAAVVAAVAMASLLRHRREGRAPERLDVLFFIDLRRHFRHAARTLANLTSTQLLTISCAELGDFDRALAAVIRAISELLDEPYAAIAPLLVAEGIAPAVPRFAARALARGSAYVPFLHGSYLGTVDAPLDTFGDALRGYAIFPAPDACASPPLFVTRFRDQLTFASCHDRRSYDDAAAGRFVEDVQSIMMRDLPHS